jgi:hypothetical protein
MVLGLALATAWTTSSSASNPVRHVQPPTHNRAHYARLVRGRQAHAIR